MGSNILYAAAQTGTIPGTNLSIKMVIHMFSNKFTQLSNVIAVVDFNKMVHKKEESKSQEILSIIYFPFHICCLLGSEGSFFYLFFSGVKCVCVWPWTPTERRLSANNGMAHTIWISIHAVMLTKWCKQYVREMVTFSAYLRSSLCLWAAKLLSSFKNSIILQFKPFFARTFSFSLSLSSSLFLPLRRHFCVCVHFGSMFTCSAISTYIPV